MLVKDLMTSNVTSILSSKKVIDAAKIMSEQNIGALPVLNESGNVIGIITETDFIGKYETIPHGLTIPSLMGEWLDGSSLEEILRSARDQKIENVMTPNPYTVSSDTSLTTAASLLLRHDISRLPVVDDGRLVGIIAKQDIVKAITNVT